MLRLLHLSDIHFGGYSPGWDEDADQRHQLVVDARGLVEDDSVPVDGILVGGDIAYSGKTEEYESARDWLGELRLASGCPDGAVWMVPGNHDVDRGQVDGSHILRDFQASVRASDLSDLDRLLSERLAQDPAAESLIHPLKTYNEFAQGFGCATTARLPYWWDATLRVRETPILLWGLNSVVVSHKDDSGGNGGRPNLVLGVHQCKVRENPGEVRIVLCHHPPSWLRDWDQVKPFLARAHVVLFGHEHSYSCDQQGERGPLYVHAGAVGPEHGLTAAPSYNLLTLDLNDEHLRVVVQPRIWSDARKTFVEHGATCEEFTVALDRRTDRTEGRVEVQPRSDKHEDEPVPAAATPLSAPVGSQRDARRPQDQTRLREIAVGYLSAPPTRRLEIAETLGVLHDEDLMLPSDRERYAAVLERIRESGLIDQLAEELGI